MAPASQPLSRILVSPAPSPLLEPPASWKPHIDDPQIQSYIFEETGEEGLELLRFMAENEPISGVDLLEAYPDQKPSEVRKILYRLMEAHAAEYEKDTDSKGWETFTWRTDLREVQYILMRRWEDELKHLRDQLRFEADHAFYSCTDQHRRIIFEDAVDLEFHCPVCREPMDAVDDRPIREALRERIAELEEQLARQ